MSIDPAPPVKTPAVLRVSLLLICIAVVGVVGLVGWRMIEQDHQVNELLAQRAQDRADAAHDRATAANDRAVFTSNQRELVDYLQAVVAQQAGENAWLRNHHIPIPQRFVTVVPPPRIVVHRHRVHHVRRHRSHHQVRHPRTAAAPTGPGKSGRAPGHRKHRHD